MNAITALSLLLILPAAAAPFIYLIGRISLKVNAKHNLAGAVALIVLLATCYPLYICIQALQNTEAIELLAYKVPFRMDGISLLITAVVLCLGIMVTVFSFTYIKKEDGEEKFYALLTAMIGMIIGLSCAADLFNLWVWFEGMAICSYMLVAFYRSQSASLEAGVKYLVQSAVGSALVILAIALVFAQTGTLDLVEIKSQAAVTPLFIIAGALFVIGFGVKSALVPLHTWLPDAHSQAPSGISAMLSGIVIEAGLIAMLRSLAPLYPTALTWGNLFMAFGAINMLLGNMMALRQQQVKRILAYSSISHMGYMLAGLGLALSFQQADGATGAFFHLTTHAMMKGLAFLSVGALMYGLFLANGSHAALNKEDLSGVAHKYPLVAFVFSLAVFSLGGLPPLAGFMSKWQIIVAGFKAENNIAMYLMIFMALNSVLSLGYYAPLVNRMYRKETSAVVQEGKKLDFWLVAPLVCLALGIVILGFYPSLLNSLFKPAAASLFSIFGI